MPYADLFAPDLESSTTEIQNAGSIIKVAPITNVGANAGYEPQVYTLTTDAAAIADASLNLFISAPAAGTTPKVFLSKGSVLYFGGAFTPVVVAADTLVDATAAPGDAVPIDPATAAIAANATALTWGLVTLLSPTDLPITDNDTTVDRTDLTYGLQGSQVKTGKEKTSQITSIATPTDRAFWEIIYPASQGAHSIFAHVIRTGGFHNWGAVKVMNLTMPGTIREILRPQFTLNFQAPYSSTTLREFLTVPQQNALDAVLRLSGV